jgi:Uncharacterized protein conserved in bacteria (DUF2320).
MAFRIDGRILDAHDRPGYEIDTRAGRTETEFSGAFDFHALSKSFIGVTASHLKTRFDDDEEYNGTNLAESLDRVDTTFGVNFRHDLTPLTSIMFSATRTDAKFDLSPDRDTTSTSALMTVSFQPEALLKGGFSVGYNDFEPTIPGSPTTRVSSALSISHTCCSAARVRGDRRTRRSVFLRRQPALLHPVPHQRLHRAADLRSVRRRGQRRNRPPGLSRPIRRDSGRARSTDRVNTVGAGVGYHMARDLRLSVNVDQNNRDSQVIDHQYERLLVGVALTYGF